MTKGYVFTRGRAKGFIVTPGAIERTVIAKRFTGKIFGLLIDYMPDIAEAMSEKASEKLQIDIENVFREGIIEGQALVSPANNVPLSN